MERPAARILIVDDERDFAESLADILLSRGYEVRITPGPEEARAAAREWEADLALLDLRLGRANGVDLIPDLRAIRPSLISLMLTGYADTEAAIIALQRGAYDFLRKPVDIPVLLAAISRALEKGRMEAERARTQADLRESEEKFRSIFQAVPDPVFIVRAEDGAFLEVNEAFLLISLFPRAGIEGHTLSDPRLWCDLPARDRFISLLRERGEIIDFEAVLCKGDGDRVVVLLSARPLLVGGIPCHLGVARDITSRKRMEQRLRDSLQEKNVLLKEIHHRVKSNLQIISGLLAIQSHYVQDPAMQAIYRESQNRLTTMALIHEKLYETDDLGRVEFAGYLRRLTEQVGLSHGAARRGIALTVEAEEVSLSVDTALPCGLILNELLTNALRHGFPEGRGGVVRVTFSRRGGRSYMLRVFDDGVGFPPGFDLLKSQRLGLRLVTVLAEGLGASWEIGNHQGTTFTLAFDEYLEAGSRLY